MLTSVSPFEMGSQGNTQGCVGGGKAVLQFYWFGFYRQGNYAILCSMAIESKPVKLETRVQPYKHFTIVNHDSSVIIWANL